MVVQALQQETQTPLQNKGKGKSSYDKWSNEEQSFLVDLWSEKHDHLESKDARIAWQEICQEIEINFGTKKTVEKCQRKIKYLIDRYKDAKTWNKTKSGGQLRKSVFYDKIDCVLGTGDVVTLKHVVKAGTRTDSPISSPTSPSIDDRDSVAPSSSSGTAGPQPITSRTSGTSSAESSNTVNCPSRARKEWKRATKRKIPEDGEDEEAISLRRSIESIEKRGEKLMEIMQGLQENQSKQLEMVASFVCSLVEAIKDKKWATLEFKNLKVLVGAHY